MAKVTIEHISRHTGLSRGTVSRALNDRPDISPATKERVLEACEKLNYVPSHAARSLATGRNFAVAAVIDDLRDVFGAAFVRGVNAVAERAHYMVHVIETAGTGIGTQSLSAGRIDAVLLGGPVSAEQQARFRDSFARRAFAGCTAIEGLDVDVFAPDHAEAGRIAARHLLSSGARDVAYVWRDGGRDHAERLAGFQEVCRERGVGDSLIVLRWPAENQAAADDSVRAGLSRVRCIAADDDALAISVMLSCARTDRVIGRDVAVIGHGNNAVAAAIRPALTSVDPGGEEAGRRAMESVLQRLGRTRMDAPQRVRIAPALFRRRSTSEMCRDT
jgi:LacI family transcriptional regulator